MFLTHALDLHRVFVHQIVDVASVLELKILSLLRITGDPRRLQLCLQLPDLFCHLLVGDI